MAAHQFYGLHRGHRTSRLRGPPVHYRATRFEVWHRQFTAIVSPQTRVAHG